MSLLVIEARKVAVWAQPETSVCNHLTPANPRSEEVLPVELEAEEAPLLADALLEEGALDEDPDELEDAEADDELPSDAEEWGDVF